MSVSIYYTAHREQPLTPVERVTVDRLVAEYSIRDHVEQHVQTGCGHNGMDFCVYDPGHPSEPDVVFEGATQLPSNDNDALWKLVQHWCRLLSEVRRVIPAATWHVHVDDHDVPWDAIIQNYDPAA